MKRNMTNWIQQTMQSKTKKAMPILSFPSIQLMDISVLELISSAKAQAEGMALIAKLCDTAASVSLMDLSVEAECFGATIACSNHEVPTVTGRVLETIEDSNALKVPQMGTCRTGIYIDAIKIAAKEITDRPVFAGCIGPFSLAGRLMDMTEIMVNCYDEPEMVHSTLEKTTQFITDYIMEFKAAGANGIVIAEPAAGLLSPALIEEFSTAYVKEIVAKVQDENFIVIYHNCGNVEPLLESIMSINAAAYHFGNAVNMATVLAKMPQDVLVMGNIDPAGQIKNGIPKTIRQNTAKLMAKCCYHPNFVISTGCDIPPMAPWTNIDAFFEAVETFNQTYESVSKFPQEKKDLALRYCVN